MNQQNQAYPSLSSCDHQEDEFFLDGQHSTADFDRDDFSLESPEIEHDVDNAPVQENLVFHIDNPEHPEDSQQIALEGMDKPIHAVTVHQVNVVTGSEQAKTVSFQHANTLLESLEIQDVAVQYQCREGYCGSCRTQLLEGQVHYIEEPMAWINDDEILPCCCIPKTAISIKLP